MDGLKAEIRPGANHKILEFHTMFGESMKTVLRIFFLTALGMVVFGAAFTGAMRPAFAQPANADFSKVDAYINETMRGFPIPGLALAIVKGDQIIYLHGYGTANTQGDPATPQTPWLMCSVSKSFTALALQQLAAAGKINLNAPLQAYLPEF
jgi:CubicO group peptidase (beta-lactamase class C family)